MTATSGPFNYQVDEKKEFLKAQILRNRLNNRVFKINEEMTNVYKQNIALQRKLDDIKYRGTGISNLQSGASIATASMRLSRGPSRDGFASNAGINKSPTAGTGRDG